MLFETVLLLILIGFSIFFVGIPLVKLIKVFVPQKRNPLKEAQERLELAKIEAEAAKLNKETEKIFEHLYEDTLETDNKDRRQV